jgi:hypothetical protein
MRSEPRYSTAIRVLGATLMLGLGGSLLPASANAGVGQSSAPRSSAGTTESRLRAANVESERQADLVAGEDQRVMEALVAGLPNREHPKVRQAYRTTSSGLNLVLTKRRAPYTFDDLRQLAPETLVPQAKGSFLLRENIIVGAGATLSISPNQPLKIKMRSGPDGFVSIVAEGGRLRLNGTASAPITIQSWDVSRGRQDTDVTDGRAYLRASGQLVARHATFSRLGFWSGRTGGVSVVGSGSTLGQDLDAGAVIDGKTAGNSPIEAGSGKTQLLPAGKLPAAAQDPNQSFGTQISDSTMVGNVFGLFLTANSGARIENTVIRKSLVDGLVLHRDVDSASIKNVRVEQSGSDGVVVSRKVEGTVLTQLVVRRNGRDGIVLAGRPLANGPSASGSSTRAFGNNVLTASQSADNVRIGVHVIGGTAVRVQGNSVSGGRSGIVVSDGATDVDIDSNRVAGSTANGIQVRESRKVTVTGNVVRNAQTGIHVRNASGMFRQNSTSGVTLHGITFVGRVVGSVAEQNLLSGSGTSAIDVVRVTDRQVPKLAANDLSGWSRTVTSDSLISVLLHPLTVIWMLVALLLLAMSRPRRATSQLPYRNDPLTVGSGAVTRVPALDEPTRERELPVFDIPQRRTSAPGQPVTRPGPGQPGPRHPGPRHPATQPSPRLPSPQPAAYQPGPAYQPVPGSQPITGPQPITVPQLTPARGAMLAPVPVLLPPPVPAAEQVSPPPVGRAGSAVIDLAIREARLNPAAPRRRRTSGR